VFAHRGINVQVGEHRRAVDGYIEFTISGCGEIGLGKVQQNTVLTARREAWNGVSEDSGSTVLIHRHGRGVGPGLGQIDGGRHRTVIPAAAEVFVRYKRVVSTA